MLLQRLVADSKCGLNYDYMGSAEYEFGATANGRSGLAKAFLEDDLKFKWFDFVEVRGRFSYPPVQVVGLARQKMIDQIPGTFRVNVTKENFRTDNSRIIGWMLVDYAGRTCGPTDNPLLILRANLDDIQNRFVNFLQPFVDQMKEAGY